MALTEGQTGHLADHEEAVYTVVHGATAGTSRPTLGSSGTQPTVVKWIGSVEPTNATNNDEWWDTANSRVKLKVSGSFVTPGNLHVVDVRRDAAQTIPNATVTAVTFDNEEFDALGYVDLATNPTRITVPASGAGIRHRFVFAVGFAGNATGRRQYKLLKNGTDSLAMTELEPPSNQAWRWDTTWEETPSSGDYYELMVYQASGGDLDTRNASSGQNPTVFIERLAEAT